MQTPEARTTDPTRPIRVALLAFAFEVAGLPPSPYVDVALEDLRPAFLGEIEKLRDRLAVLLPVVTSTEEAADTIAMHLEQLITWRALTDSDSQEEAP